jgi:RNA polymerase subunit RPABC4/transcription elongation factor Spt4
MSRVCIGCGNEIPEGQDFCYVCGAWAKNALIFEEEGDQIYANVCVSCHKTMPSDAEFCPYCGSKSEPARVPVRVRSPTKISKMDIMAIILAVVPGFFNIFGLGQIVQRSWSKAFVFICVTVIFFYVAPGFMGTTNGYIILLVMQLAIFIFSISDVFRNIGRRGI